MIIFLDCAEESSYEDDVSVPQEVHMYMYEILMPLFLWLFHYISVS